MHATKVLQKILSAVIAGLDVRNARNLFFAVEALLLGRRLTLMELARHFPGAERVNAPLKRFDIQPITDANAKLREYNMDVDTSVVDVILSSSYQTRRVTECLLTRFGTTRAEQGKQALRFK